MRNIFFAIAPPQSRGEFPYVIGSEGTVRLTLTKRLLLRGALAALLLAMTILAAGFFVPERLVIPVARATEADWNHRTFWHYPWGRSVVHAGIDIFAGAGTTAVSATPGIVVFQGRTGRGGNVVVVLGPKWRFHYYAHLKSAGVGPGELVSRAEPVGEVGATGNAAGKPPHLHYSIFTPIPYPWLYDNGRLGWMRMFVLNPHERLTARGP